MMQAVEPTPDSFYQKNFVAADVAEQWFQQLMADQDLWAPRDHKGMAYRGNPLQRTKAFLWRSLQFYRPFQRVPFIAELVEDLRQTFTFNDQTWNFNHCIATHYTGRTDNIGWHNDKTRDFTPGSPILIFSLGQSRELHLKANEKPEEVITVDMCAGSLFILGPQTNATWKHSIPVAAHEVGSRISLIFRDIATEIDTLQSAIARKIFAT